VLCALADAVGYDIIRRTPVQPEQVMAVVTKDTRFRVEPLTAYI